MAGIVGQGTTFNLPQYVGELFGMSPEDTPFRSAIGGLTGGKRTASKRFEWQNYDLRAAADRQRLEGANAPSPEERVRGTAFNVVEVHQEAVELSYTRMAIAKAGDPVTNEMDWQKEQHLKQVARDVEFSFIRGTFAEPADNTLPRKTRGILEAITTNVIDKDPDAALAEDDVLDLMQLAWENGGLQEGETRTLMVGAARKRDLTRIFITDKGYAESTRNVAGVNLSVIETDFGRTNIMLNRYMPADTIAAVSLEECAPVFLEVPGLGFLFFEPLAKVGAAAREQLYGEIGLESGNQIKHAKITGLIDA
jgi:hypothetical protein